MLSILPAITAVLMLTAATAHAARPFVTDDARIVDAGGCQIETFAKVQQRENENEMWFLPGCTPARGLDSTEITVGGNKIDNAGSGTANTLIAQVKTLLKPLQTDGWGFAATLGTLRQHPANVDASWSPYVNLVGSRSLLHDAVVLHVNAGQLRDRTILRNRYTWGLGAEIALGEKLYGIVESYNQAAEKPSSQVGLRYWITPNRVQIDSTVGTQAAPGGRRTWTSIGMRFLF